MKKIFLSRYLILIIVIGFFLFGCATTTTEYKMVKAECSSQAYQQYPIDNHIEVKTEYRQVRVKTGEICRQHGGVLKMVSCDTQYAYKSEPYQKKVSVDLNADKRDQTISSCTRSQCLTKYGNEKC
jgi:hypothetical protein